MSRMLIVDHFRIDRIETWVPVVDGCPGIIVVSWSWDGSEPEVGRHALETPVYTTDSGRYFLADILPGCGEIFPVQVVYPKVKKAVTSGPSRSRVIISIFLRSGHFTARFLLSVPVSESLGCGALFVSGRISDSKKHASWCPKPRCPRFFL